MSIQRQALESYFSALLRPEGFKDYGPNGLQVEGAPTVTRIVFAVSATAESIAGAAAAGAEALVVHHGLFWKFHGARPLVGPFAKRIFPLVRHQINLFAYHLPLDAHQELGNAAMLAKGIGLSELEPFGDCNGAPTGVKGRLEQPLDAAHLQERLETLLQHPVLLASSERAGAIQSIGIITGGANGDWKLAAAEGLDAYITGEMSEHDWHESREAGVTMFAGGHHATERLGIKALMARVQEDFGVDCRFLDSENPA